MPMLALLLAGALLDRAHPAFDAMKAQQISAAVRFLSDDLLEGRGTGTRGHAIAERFVAAQMQALGLAPAGEDGFFQRVKLCESRAQGTLAVNGATVGNVLVAGDCGAPARDLEGELAFAGYAQPGEVGGLQGKIALVLAGAPASLPSTQQALAASNEEKLARLRGAGAIAEIVLTTPEVDARRPWALLQRNFANGQAHDADQLPPMPVVYVDLRESEKLRGNAGQRAKLHVDQQNRTLESANVVGLLPGASKEMVVYSAHLDHHGICAPGAADAICNGAIDNATGIAEMLEIARGFAALPKRERSVLFVAVTGEERGLLGSAWFARHPTVSREQMIANLNLDQLLPAYPLGELVLRGAELSTLEDHVRAAAGELGLKIVADPVPEQNFFARSDQLNFARIGVPSACLWQGFSGARGEAAFKDFRAHRYHQPSDEWSAAYDWEAAAQMARAELLVGVSLLTGPRPKWKRDAPFR
ncbi:MAG TPA: M28 family peptidase [Myxococcales bacterium]|nr:M28 family peptidase [Myxococcales bacterium]